MKIIAFHLPQFHEIPENNEWWGQGFTEWTNVKKAQPQFESHYQPRQPLGDHYYNMLDQSTREWQATLAKRYGIYGFCYYHYWFAGRKLLEKPLEDLLKSEEPDFPFCLSWANHSWTRAWDGNKREMLIEQTYGDERAWEDHFYYLLKFFKDSRYIKVDDKPLFIIFNPSHIKKCDEMLALWDKLALENGLCGMHFLEMLTTYNNMHSHKRFDGKIEFEPMYTIKYKIPFWKVLQRPFNRFLQDAISIFDRRYKKGFLNVMDYDYVWENILSRKPSNKNTYLGAFVDWDNTARRGSKAFIIKGASPEKFKKYLSIQVKRSSTLLNNDMLFLNAWNEWAEGCYLEPDKKYGYKYLEVLRDVLLQK